MKSIIVLGLKIALCLSGCISAGLLFSAAIEQTSPINAATMIIAACIVTGITIAYTIKELK